MWLDGYGNGHKHWMQISVSWVIHPKGGSQQSHQQADHQFAPLFYLLNVDTADPLAE